MHDFCPLGSVLAPVAIRNHVSGHRDPLSTLSLQEESQNLELFSLNVPLSPNNVFGWLTSRASGLGSRKSLKRWAETCLDARIMHFLLKSRASRLG